MEKDNKKNKLLPIERSKEIIQNYLWNYYVLYGGGRYACGYTKKDLKKL